MKVDKFIFLVDFVIMDLEDKVKVPLIFGTSRTLTDVKDGQMVLRVGEEEVVIKLWDAIWDPMDFDDTCYYVDAIDDNVFDFVQ